MITRMLAVIDVVAVFASAGDGAVQYLGLQHQVGQKSPPARF